MHTPTGNTNGTTGRLYDVIEQARELEQRHQPQEALAVLAIARKLAKDAPKPDLATVLAIQARLLDATDSSYQAEILLRRALDIRRVYLGREHADTWKLQTNLASLLYRRGACAESQLLLAALLKIQQSVGSDQTRGTERLLAQLHTEARLRDAGARGQLQERVARWKRSASVADGARPTVVEPPDPLCRGVDVQWLHDEFLPHVRNTDWPTAQRRCLDRAAAHASKATTRPLDSVLSSALTSLTDVVHAAQLQHALSRDVGGAVEAEGTRACANGSKAPPGVNRASKAPTQQCVGVGARTLVPVESDHALSARNDSSAGCRRGSPLEAPLWTAATVTVRQVACSLIAPEAWGHSFYGLIEPGCKGKPDVYVLYADDVPFARLVEALCAHCKPHLDRGESPSIWLDVFALEQPLHVACGAGAAPVCDDAAPESVAAFLGLARSEAVVKDVLFVDGSGAVRVWTPADVP